MTHLLLWLLLYPLVAAADIYIRSQVATVDPGAVSRIQAFVYAAGAIVFILVHVTHV